MTCLADRAVQSRSEVKGANKIKNKVLNNVLNGTFAESTGLVVNNDGQPW